MKRVLLLLSLLPLTALAQAPAPATPAPAPARPAPASPAAAKPATAGAPALTAAQQAQVQKQDAEMGAAALKAAQLVEVGSEGCDFETDCSVDWDCSWLENPAVPGQNGVSQIAKPSPRTENRKADPYLAIVRTTWGGCLFILSLCSSILESDNAG